MRNQMNYFILQINLPRKSTLDILELGSYQLKDSTCGA